MSDTAIARTTGGTPSSEAAEAWRRFTDALAAAGSAVYARENIGRDAAQQAEITESMVYTLLVGLMTFTNADRDHPEFTPVLNSGIRRYATNADTVYLQALVKGAGRYRIVGRRGTVGILNFQVYAGNQGISEISVRSEVSVPLTPPGGNGDFEILLSAERPKGYDGLWLQLDPALAEQFVAVRYVAKDWSREIDPQIAIEPLHCSIRKMRDNPTGLLDRLQLVPAYVQGATEELMTIMRNQLGRLAAPNELTDVTDTFPIITDGHVSDHYWPGLHPWTHRDRSRRGLDRRVRSGARLVLLERPAHGLRLQHAGVSVPAMRHQQRSRRRGR